VQPQSTTSELVAKCLAGLIAVVFCGIGAMAVWTSEYSGRTRYGKDVFFQGVGAELFGWLMIAAGLLPIAAILRERRSRLWWTAFALLIGLAGAAFTLLR
jgi:drug/metabolite transporter (DMT)-like permease